jgi:hypothetical protein
VARNFLQLETTNICTMSMISKTNGKEVVLSYLRALNDEDFEAARRLVTDDLVFDGVLGSRRGADEYFMDMAKMKFKYKVIKAFAENDDVCVLYDIDMAGLPVFTCGYYHLEHEKIKSLRVVFDPRPVLEAANRK